MATAKTAATTTKQAAEPGAVLEARRRRGLGPGGRPRRRLARRPRRRGAVLPLAVADGRRPDLARVGEAQRVRPNQTERGEGTRGGEEEEEGSHRLTGRTAVAAVRP
jgi:hypothetical protein